ncbi:hypothetical protein [Mesorhizobium sp. 1M-11]|uniref:hypothetical protein n=1 Tax=Mesorhizobium sp. 1M-11 TaxID=1529006 RepID=UPI0006C74D9E|nr:hypothetical protein [Mesorhizobium sp. 1M-11]
MAEQSSLSPQLETEQASLVVRRVATIALLAVLLGFAMQGLILGAKLLAGGPFPGTKLFVDLTQGVTWSLLVCAGVGIGTSIMKIRAALAGLVAALFAPIALAVAKSAQKVMASAIGVVDQPAALSLVTISAMRAVEYGILGWVLASLVQKEVKSASAYLGTGSTVGIVFGGAIAVLGYHAASLGGQSPSSAQVAASLVNEIVSPIGCALVIYCGQLVGRNVSMLSGRG